MPIPKTHDSLPPHKDTSAEDDNYEFYQHLGTSWSQSLLAVPLVLLAAGFVLWLGHQPTIPLQARVDVREEVKAIGTSGQVKASPSEPIPVGTSGITPRGPVTIIGPPVKRLLPGNVGITMPAGSAEDRLAAFLESSASGAPTIAIDRIVFTRGSARLSRDARAQIDRIATILRAYPNVRVIVASHTDDAGQEAANFSLSLARATAVNDRLIKHGVAPGRVHARGFGSQQPFADNSQDSVRSQTGGVTLQIDRRP